MRWAVSFLLFFFGAAFVGLEVFTSLALLEKGRSAGEVVLSLNRFIVLSAACLAAAVWLSPVNRWRSLGRSLLAGAGLGLIGAAPVYAAVPDPYALTWKVGLANLLAIVAAGALLDRRSRSRSPA